MSAGGVDKRKLGSGHLSDGLWHFVVVKKKGTKLRVAVNNGVADEIEVKDEPAGVRTYLCLHFLVFKHLGRRAFVFDLREG